MGEGRLCVLQSSRNRYCRAERLHRPRADAMPIASFFIAISSRRYDFVPCRAWILLGLVSSSEDYPPTCWCVCSLAQLHKLSRATLPQYDRGQSSLRMKMATKPG